jgi:hypothetical protein
MFCPQISPISADFLGKIVGQPRRLPAFRVRQAERLPYNPPSQNLRSSADQRFLLPRIENVEIHRLTPSPPSSAAVGTRHRVVRQLQKAATYSASVAGRQHAAFLAC